MWKYAIHSSIGNVHDRAGAQKLTNAIAELNKSSYYRAKRECSNHNGGTSSLHRLLDGMIWKQFQLYE